MQRQRDSFTLLYNQLWLIDETKLKQVNPGIKLEPWLNLSDESSAISRKSTVISSELPVKVEASKPVVMPELSTKSNKSELVVPEQNMKEYSNWDSLVESANKCTRCKLFSGRKNVVIERGNRNAKWMFIGEGPGENEDLQGLPFVGVSGELLNKMIAAMNLDYQKDVYICNVVKCRPPYNRNPEPDEIEQCNNYLLSQINLVKPDIIITLGRFASQTVLNTDSAVNKMRGRIHKFNNIPVIVTFHPSYLLRNVSAKSGAWDDLKLAMKVFKDVENKN